MVTFLAAETTSSTTALWFTLAAGLGGVLLTGIFALTTAIVNHRWQREDIRHQVADRQVEQLRQERLESYIAYWSALQAYEEALRAIAETPLDSQIEPQLLERARDARQELKTGTARVRLISSPQVLQALNQVIRDRSGLREAAFNREASRFAPGQLGIENSALMDCMRIELQSNSDLSQWE